MCIDIYLNFNKNVKFLKGLSMSIYIGFYLTKPIESKKRYKNFITELDQLLQIHSEEIIYK